MGLLDNKLTINYIPGNVTIEQINEAIQSKLKDKYKVELLKKGSVAAQAFGGKSTDGVFIVKNAYHRTFITLSFISKEESQQPEDQTMVSFDNDGLKWWLKILSKEVGFIGGFILKTMYGKSNDYYEDIENALKDKFELKQREENFGVSKLWKKD
ncbi:hypothetical protein HNQ02_000430 [Flavobacterium sp. 7E]|uniref:hypothetical protein n=1 Tax=Flavobacterium sp. 7E TaxID=2735898 RepID=UPI00156EC893|nr:hypothetical protein [Flavobacterium sp. 7E]NRS87523.1 hypothetical protein [Flavobacterium sp. 7E]